MSAHSSASHRFGLNRTQAALPPLLECCHNQSQFGAMQGLDVIHGCGLVHGDIKPNNIRTNKRPDGSQVHLVITDLGNSCDAGSSEPRVFCIAPGSALRLELLYANGKCSHDVVLWTCIFIVTVDTYVKLHSVAHGVASSLDCVTPLSGLHGLY